MNKKAIITILFAVILGLASCNRDSNYEDKVEQVTVYVSAEIGMFYNVPNTTLEEGMMIRIHIVPVPMCIPCCATTSMALRNLQPSVRMPSLLTSTSWARK